MSAIKSSIKGQPITGLLFRVLLFASAASLALYIPYKYATQLHAISGSYAVLFPLSIVLAIAGIVFAVKPKSSCSCNVPTRAGLGTMAVLWTATGVLCVPSLTMSIMSNPPAGLFAAFHMSMQHVFLTLGVLGFVLVPKKMTYLVTGSLPEQAEPSEALTSGI